MDYKEGNGDKLFAARNENSVLFSLDSLMADENNADNGAGAGGASSDASGLIDLNTLSKMSQSGPSEADGEAGVAMESLVFNQVVTKKQKKKTLLVVVLIVVLVGAIAGAAIYFISQAGEKAEIASQDLADAEKAAQEKQAELEAQIAELQRQAEDAKKALEISDKNKDEIQKQIDELHEKELAAQVALADAKDKNKTTTTTTKTGSGSSKTGNTKTGGSSSSGSSSKKEIGRDELLAALQSANKKATKCGKGGNLKLSFSISGNKAKNIKVAGGSFAGSATEKCIITVVEKHNWPDGTATVTYPFKL